MTQSDFLRWLVEVNGYVFPQLLPEGRYACINPRMYNTQIITGRVGDTGGFSTAW